MFFPCNYLNNRLKNLPAYCQKSLIYNSSYLITYSNYKDYLLIFVANQKTISMKNWKILGMFLLFLGACQQPQPPKTGYVDMQQLTKNYTALNQLKTEFKQKEESFQRKYDSLGKAFQAKYNQFLHRAQKMPKVKASKEYQQLMYEQQQISLKQQQEYQQIQNEAQKKTQELLDNMEKFIKHYGQQHGYIYIFAHNDFNGVIYGDSTKNITDAILEALNGKANTKETQATK